MPRDNSTWTDDASAGFPVVRGIVILTVVAFVVQQLGDFRAGGSIARALSLSREGVLLEGRWWQLVTYQLLHAGFLHILMNMVVLFSFGRELEQVLGAGRFLALYVISGVVGGVGWLVLSGGGGVSCVGASGAVFGIAAAFAALDPDRELRIVVFPIPVPITLKARTLVLVYAAISVLFLLSSGSSVAHAAHLSGGLCGYAYGRRLRPRLRWGGWAPPATPPDPDPEPTGEEVDRILEKIKASGLESLTRRERATLERASSGKAGRG